MTSFVKRRKGCWITGSGRVQRSCITNEDSFVERRLRRGGAGRADAPRLSQRSLRLSGEASSSSLALISCLTAPQNGKLFFYAALVQREGRARRPARTLV